MAFTKTVTSFITLFLIISLCSCESEENKTNSMFYVVTKNYVRNPIFASVSVSGEIQELYEFERSQIDGFISLGIYYSLSRSSVINTIDINTGDFLKSMDYSSMKYWGYENIFTKVNDKLITTTFYFWDQYYNPLIRFIDPETLHVQDSLFIEGTNEQIVDVQQVGNKVFLATPNDLLVYDAVNWESIGKVDIQDFYLKKMYLNKFGKLLLHTTDAIVVIDVDKLQIEKSYEVQIANSDYNSITYSSTENKVYFKYAVSQPSVTSDLFGILHLNTDEVQIKDFSIGGEDLMYNEDFKYVISGHQGFIKIFNEEREQKIITFDEGIGHVKLSNTFNLFYRLIRLY